MRKDELVSFKIPEKIKEFNDYVNKNNIPENQIWVDGEYMRIINENPSN